MDRRLPFERCEAKLARLAREMEAWPGVTAAAAETVETRPLGMGDPRDGPLPKGLQLVIDAESHERLHEAWNRAAGRINGSDYGFASGASEDGPTRIRVWVEAQHPNR